jgi:hypothetical protein
VLPIIGKLCPVLFVAVAMLSVMTRLSSVTLPNPLIKQASITPISAPIAPASVGAPDIVLSK